MAAANGASGSSPQCVETVLWNHNKFYLRELPAQGIRIAPTVFVRRGEPEAGISCGGPGPDTELAEDRGETGGVCHRAQYVADRRPQSPARAKRS